VKNRASGYSSATETSSALERSQYSHSSYINVNCWDISLIYSAGGLYSTIGDLYKWDQALYTDQLVSEDILSRIFTATVSMPMGVPGLKEFYGYGWIISKKYGHQIIEHRGGANGFNSCIARYPEDQVTIIVLSNTDYILENAALVSDELAGIVFR